MRPAQHDDIDYFIEAGREFCRYSPYTFDEDSYTIMMHGIIKDPDVISRVIPGEAHCFAKLVPSFYNGNEIIARVFSTWGAGGLECFKAIEKEARAEGATYIIADSYIEPRIMQFYERIGMKQADAVFIKEL